MSRLVIIEIFPLMVFILGENLEFSIDILGIVLWVFVEGFLFDFSGV